MARILRQLPIDSITQAGRHRRDMGDIPALAASVTALGLLQPIVVTAAGRLIAGARRLAAVKQLGWDRAPAYVVDDLAEAADLLRAERDENTCRKDFVPSEAVAIGEALEKLERVQAKRRQAQAAGKPQGRKQAEAVSGGKLPPQTVGKTRDLVATAVGLSGKTYSKAKAVVEAAAADPRAFGDLVDRMDRSGKVDGAFKELDRRREQQEQRAKAKELDSVPLDGRADLRVASMQELLPTLRNIDAIITDPPYPEEFLPLYGELARLAKAALGPKGILAVMCGQSHLLEIGAAMAQHMPYRWALAYLTPGGQAVQLWQRKVNTFWKPILIFGGAEAWTGDVVRSSVNDNDKRFHEWGQSESGMRELIEKLTRPGDMVCDPFMGAGTTGVVCVGAARRFVGCDTDPAHVATARDRIVLELAKGEGAETAA